MLRMIRKVLKCALALVDVHVVFLCMVRASLFIKLMIYMNYNNHMPNGHHGIEHNAAYHTTHEEGPHGSSIVCFMSGAM